MLLAVDARLAGILAVADTVKDGAAEAVAALPRAGRRRGHVERRQQPHRRARSRRQLGIDRVIADVLPAGQGS